MPDLEETVREQKKPLVHYYYYTGGQHAHESLSWALRKEQQEVGCTDVDDYFMSRGSRDKLCCSPKDDEPTHPFAIVELDYGRIRPDRMLAILRNPHYKQIWVIACQPITEMYAAFHPESIAELRACCDVHEEFKAMVVRTRT